MKTCSFLAACFHRGEGGAWWAVLGKEWAASQAGGWDRVNAGWAMRGQSLGPGSGTQHSCAGMSWLAYLLQRPGRSLFPGPSMNHVLLPMEALSPPSDL